MKKEFTLEGLNCKSCLENIVNEINLDNIEVKYSDLSISFVVDEGKDSNKLFQTINKIINSHNHQITINEKRIENLEDKTLFIGNLTCTNCARKIESKVRNIAGVKRVELDFVNSKLNLEIDSKHNLPRIIKETKDIVKLVEPSAFVEEEKVAHEGGSKIVKATLIRLGIALIPFLFGMFLNIAPLYKTILFLTSYLVVGKSVIIKAVRNIFSGNVFDENTLMMVATIGAFIIGEYHEAVAVMAFYLVGEMFQDLAVDRSRKSIANLMDIKSDYANLEVEGDYKKVNPAEVKVGSNILVRPGEKVPIDGVVVKGETALNTANITGEAIPKYATVGSQVLSGFINQDKPIVVETTKEYNDSTVNKILEMVEQASTKKAKTENFITKFSRIYTPIVVLIATLLAVIPPLVFQADFNVWLYRALSFLVVSCPCALVISVPLGFYAGIGFASRNGIMVKGGNYLEALKNSEEIVFDKTGTLTTGRFEISEINAEKLDSDKLLELAALAEYYSIHPIATTIKEAYGKELDQSRIKYYEETNGLGINAKIDGLDVLIGNKRLLEKHNIELAESSKHGTVLYIAINGEYVGNIVIIDSIKVEALETITSLKNQGVKKITMVTGDKKEVALSVANKLGIDEVYAEVLPHEKVEIIESKVKENNKKVIFVGDGVNDAPVIAISDIGIAMGSMGSDAAIEASDIVIMNDDLSKISKARGIAKRTSKIVWENIIFALLVKVLVLVLAGFGFVNMWVAVFADVGVSLIAILNAMRLMQEKEK
ncbi:MAG TPA: cadmium-translocating P-type ATPase [Acholeplasmataceae bacterium]|nr:cadmium-translocating P-type ATPase [Acholeplasmataceae bacterium]